MRTPDPDWNPGDEPVVQPPANPGWLSDLELASADAYEPEPYVRVDALLCSGKRAWVYADGRTLLPGKPT